MPICRCISAPQSHPTHFDDCWRKEGQCIVCAGDTDASTEARVPGAARSCAAQFLGAAVLQRVRQCRCELILILSSDFHGGEFVYADTYKLRNMVAVRPKCGRMVGRLSG